MASNAKLRRKKTVWDKGFRIGLLVSIVAIAIALFQNSRNSHYQYFNNGNQVGIVDTRTGEFWTEEGSHFEPRTARITVHQPIVEDTTAEDTRTKAFSDCLWNHAKTPKLCVAESRAAQITEHPTAHPSIEQAKADDALADNFQQCLSNHVKTPEQCVAELAAAETTEQKFDFQAEPQPSSPSQIPVSK
jgi:hypothetical protein